MTISEKFSDNLILKLPYSPKNPCLDEIVKDAVKALSIDGYISLVNADSLDEELNRLNYLAGIEFDDSLANIKSYPDKLPFSLRFPSKLRCDYSIANAVWPTTRLIPESPRAGPRYAYDNDGGYPGYVREGFVQIQNAISMSFIKNAGKINELPEISMQRFPYTYYIEDRFFQDVNTILSFITMLSLLNPATVLASRITSEKEKNLTDVLKMTGIANWIQWAARFVPTFAVWTTAQILMLLLLKMQLKNEIAVFKHSNFIILIIFVMMYVIVSICYCFMMSVFFSKANMTAVVVGLGWILTYVPFTSLESTRKGGFFGQTLWCLVFNTGMALGMEHIAHYEAIGEGVHWNNIFETIEPNEAPLGVIIAMLLVDAILFLIICLYIEQIFPGKYSGGKKWNFLCTRECWKNKRGTKNQEYDMEKIENVYRSNPQAFEEEPNNKLAVVKVINLERKFADHYALKGISFQMYENEITVFIGDNGSGKTTLTSVLAGMVSPTEGTAIINGFDIRTNEESARLSMGICPDQNVLFDDLSVQNHIVLFSRLRGLKNRAVKEEVKKYLNAFNMTDEANLLVSDLSNSMKRKLSVICALCGGTKVVLCDEPELGMNPRGKTQMWNLLFSEKNGRAIFLTTQRIDEADALADRTAVMAEGKMECYGTYSFIRKLFETPYKLICVKNERCKVSEVTEIINKHIPGLKPASDDGTKLTYIFPGHNTHKFEEMFSDLQSRLEILGLAGFGVEIASMSEVFAKTEGVAKLKFLARRAVQINETASSKEKPRISNTKSWTLINQFEAMFLKNILFVWNKKLLFLLQIILAIVMLIYTLLSTKDVFAELPAMSIGLQNYIHAVAVLEVTPNVTAKSIEWKIANEYRKIIESHGSNYEWKSTGKLNFTTYITSLKEANQRIIDATYLAAATIAQKEIIAWLNNQYLHTAPLTLNLVHNAIAKAVIGPNAEISVSNHPVNLSVAEKLERLEESDAIPKTIALILIIISAIFVYLPMKERVTNSKLLQRISGVKIWVYWLTQFLFDMMKLFFFTVVIIIVILCLRHRGYSNVSDLMPMLLFIMIFGFCVLPCTYLMGYLFKDPLKGFSSLLIIYYVTGYVGYYFYMLVKTAHFKVENNMRKILSTFPHFSLLLGLTDLYKNTLIQDLCAEQAPSSSIENKCKMIPVCCDIVDYFDMKEPGVLVPVYYFLIIGCLAFLLIFLIDHRVRGLCLRHKTETYDLTQSDGEVDDVYAEKKRMSVMRSNDTLGEVLVAQRLTKYINDVAAINQISFSVKKHECFGVLGVAGAGKTTLFRILTGVEHVSSGKVYVKGLNLSKDLHKIYKKIGYCPQKDALVEDYTGRQVLRMYCTLRNIPRRQIHAYAEALATQFGFFQYIDKRIITYSYGNKRKLSAAIAIIGSPSVIYIEEPTVGMDPAGRRQLWNTMCSLRDSGKAIFLSTQSMEECEVLCTRLGIMVNGKLKAMGSIQHLKNRYSNAVTLSIKVKMPINTTSSNESPGRKDKQDQNLLISGESSTSSYLSVENDRNGYKILGEKSSLDFERLTNKNDDITAQAIEENYQSPQLAEDLNAVKKAVQEKFPLAKLEDQFKRRLTFSIPLNGLNWSEIFGFVERNLVELKIENYFVQQKTLEEIFLEFVEDQKETIRN